MLCPWKLVAVLAFAPPASVAVDASLGSAVADAEEREITVGTVRSYVRVTG